MCSDPTGADWVNQFALVAYIPDPLGAYLDRLRKDLVPACQFRSHVTFLPPRSLTCTPEEAIDQIQRQLENFSAFEIGIRSVEVFRETSVIYLGIGSGREFVIEMHEDMNRDCLYFDEPYPFHPHITLAQNFPCENVRSLYQTACDQWRAAPSDRIFPVETLTFVQKTADNTWVNLAECNLKYATVIR